MSLRLSVWTAMIAAGLLASSGSRAQDDNPGNTLVSVEATSNVSMIHPGERFLLAFRFAIEPKWHIYWQNPGETGSPTLIKIDAPEGFKIGQIIWPRPLILPGDLTSYGYEDEAVMFVPVAAPDTLERGEVSFAAKIEWFVCQDICYIGNADRTITVAATSEAAAEVDASGDTGGEQTEDIDSKRDLKTFDDPHLARAYAHVPRRLNRNKQADFTLEGDTLTITGPAMGREEMSFIPNHTSGVETEVIEAVVSDVADTFRLVLDVSVKENNLQGQSPIVGGLINLGPQQTDPSFEFTFNLRKRNLDREGTPEDAKPERARGERNREEAGDGG